jgi:hypothetical protein
MLEYKYTYLLMGTLFFLVWIGLYLYRKNTRKEMVAISLVISLTGPISNIIYMKDWWKPLTIWGPKIGIIESLIVAFSIGGIMAVIYEDLFKKKIKLRKNRNKSKDNKRLLFLMVSTAILMFVFFYLFSLNSFWAINLCLVYAISIIIYHRPDLIVEASVSAVAMFFVASFVYGGLEFLTPGWIDSFWYWQNVPRIIFLNVPIDDTVNYLLIGAFVGTLYEYWQEGRCIPLAAKARSY